MSAVPEPDCFHEVYHLEILMGIAKYVVYQPDHRCLLWYFYDPEKMILQGYRTLYTYPNYHDQTFKKIQPKDFPLYAYLTATILGERWYKNQNPNPSGNVL